MKSLSITIVVIILIFASCSTTPVEKAKHTLKSYLDTTLNDAKSYESVSWGELEKLYPFKKYSKEIDSLTIIRDSLYTASRKGDIFSDKNDRLFKEAMKITTKIRDLLRLPIEEDTLQMQMGWKISHKYRASNKMGGVVLTDDVFRLNMTLDTVYGRY